MTAKKVSLYSLPDLKSTLDDHIPLYLTSSNPHPSTKHPLPAPSRFAQSYALTLIRLAIGYTAVAIAGYICYLDYIAKVPFKNTKGLILAAVVVYFALNAALTVWDAFVERGLVFKGSRASGKGKSGTTTTNLSVRSLRPASKYEPVYVLSADWDVQAAEGQVASGSVNATVEFRNFFTVDGYFEPGAFEAWLRKEVPAIDVEWVLQKVGGGTAVGLPGKGERQELAAVVVPEKTIPIPKVEYDETDEDVGVASTPSSSVKATGSSTPSGKKGRKRKT